MKTLQDMGHPAEKIELIVMGGTFLALPEEYRNDFIKGCYDGLNGIASTNLEEAKKFNETTKHRCVGLCIETRPDWCTEKQIQQMLVYGATRVELGVQAIDDNIYKIVRRGHTVADVIKATKLLKQYGFKVYYHWMPGLPGSSPSHDIEMSRELFTNDDFKPDGLKLYPTLVIMNSELHQWYQEGRYEPYSTAEAADVIIEIKKFIPKYVRIPRVMRDIPPKFIVAGCKDTALRGTIKQRLKEIGTHCRCTRCREYGHRRRDGWHIGEPQLKRFDYQSAGDKEVFLSFEDDNETLFGLLRLRRCCSINGENNIAMVREIHVFGAEVPLGQQNDNTAQHLGLGGKLLKEAEKISREEFGARKLAIISGLGVRNYFRSEFGYQQDGEYMVKELAQ